MPISRVMNMPDGSTPVPQLGGGTNQGTLARSILHHQAGTGCIPRDTARHLIAQTSSLGIVGAVAPIHGPLDEQPEAGVEDVGGETTSTEPADRAAADGDDAGDGSSGTKRNTPRRRPHR